MRQVVAWSTLILFGTVSLLGHGLHALVGCHPITHCALDDQAGSGLSACCSCPHARSTRPAEDQGEDAEGHLVAGHDDDCLICRFLAQGRELTRGVLPPCVQFARRHHPVAGPISPSLPADEPYQARAPPLSS